MKGLVTGCAGFIGSHTVDRLVQTGMSIVGVDNLSRPGTKTTVEYLAKRHGEKFTFKWVDVREVDSLVTVFKEFGPFHLVVHEAGQVAVTTSILDPRFDFDVNARGTLNLLDVYRIHNPSAVFIFASTNKVYGSLEKESVVREGKRYVYSVLKNGISEDQPLDFHSPYGCSKGAADQYVSDFGRIYGLKTFVLRQSCIYGIRQYGMEDQGWVAWFVIAALLGKSITIYGDGFQSRDLLWVDDLVDLYVRVFEQADAVGHRVFNVGGGKDSVLSLQELLQMLENMRILKQTVKYAKDRVGDQKTFVADIDLVRKEFGWRPTIPPEIGVGRLVHWARDNIGDLRQLCEGR